MPQAVTIRSLPRAFALGKGMQAHGLEWGESYRPLGRQAIADVLPSSTTAPRSSRRRTR